MRACPRSARSLAALTLASLLAACGRATLEDESWSPLSGGRAGPPGGAKAGAAGASAGASGAAQKAGAGGASGAAGAAGTAGAPFGSCVALLVEGPVDLDAAVGARATTVPDDARVVVATWEEETTSNMTVSSRLVDAWGAWPPAIGGPIKPQFAGPLPQLVLARGSAPSTYAAFTAPLVDALPGQLLTLAVVDAGGTYLSGAKVDDGADISPLAASRAGAGHAVLYELPPYASLATVNGDTVTSLGPVGCAISPMVGDVADIAGSAWALFASSRPLGTCLLDDGVLGLPSMLQLARVSGSEASLLGVVAAVEGDPVMLARLFAAPTGALLAHRYAGTNALVQPGLTIRRVGLDGATLAGPVEVLGAVDIQSAGLAAIDGVLLVARRVDGATLALSTHAPEAGDAALATAALSTPVTSVELVVAEPGGARALVGWIAKTASGPRAQVARVSCLAGE